MNNLVAHFSSLLLQLGRTYFVKTTSECISVITDFNSPGEISSIVFFKNHFEILLIGGEVIKILNEQYESKINRAVNHINYVDSRPHPAL